MSAVVNIMYIVAKVKSTLRIDGADDESIIELVREGLEKLHRNHLDIFGNETIIYNVNPALNIVPLPKDYTNYVRIGEIQAGQIVNFTVNPNIAIPVAESCGLQTNPFHGHNSHEHYGLQLGAVGGYTKVTYKIDKKNKQIHLQGRGSNVATHGEHKYYQIVMEYIGTGISRDSLLAIPVQYVDAVKAYVIQEILENDPRVPLGDKQRKSQRFINEVKIASWSEMPSLSEIVACLYQGATQGIHRAEF
jgi:hypothetical protein